MNRGIDCIGNSVVFICHDGDGNYALAKRSDQCRDEHGRWDCGGGGIELHDTVLDTLYKEIEEEFGTTPIAHEFLGYRDVHRIHEGEKSHWIALDFKVLVDREKVRNAEPHKHEEIRWFRMGEFPEPMHSQWPHFLEKYRERL